MARNCFYSPYVWDGVSNIVVNVTHSGANDINNSQTYFTANSGNTTIWQRSITGTTVAGAFSANKLNIRFTGAKILPVTWTPTAGLFTDAAATVAYTGTATPTIYAKPTATTQYTATATNNSGCVVTAISEITVNTTSLPTASSPQTFITGETLANLVVAGTGLIWYSDTTTTTALPTSTVLVSGSTYYVSQTVNGCEGARLPIAVEENLSNPSFDLTNFKFYPNPVKNVLNFTHTQNITDISIFNMLGQKVMYKSINNSQGQIDMSSLPHGTYVVKVNIDNIVKNIKIAKE